MSGDGRVLGGQSSRRARPGPYAARLLHRLEPTVPVRAIRRHEVRRGVHQFAEPSGVRFHGGSPLVIEDRSDGQVGAPKLPLRAGQRCVGPLSATTPAVWRRDCQISEVLPERRLEIPSTDRSPQVSLTLLDWRRAVAALYADVRAARPGGAAEALARFRAGRDRLFREHPDSPLPPEARAAFGGIPYWPHDPTLRFAAEVEPLPPIATVAVSLDGEEFPLERIGRVRLPVGDLEIYWIAVYGGGVFVPFRDATSGTETYAAGRYLLDTVKGADLGGSGGRLVLDFNYAYHPSCAYDPRWSCPLAPPSNRLNAAIRAGERLARHPLPGAVSNSTPERDGAARLGRRRP